MDEIQTIETTHKILANSEIGLWAIEIDENAEPRMYGDSIMKKLLGVKDNITPEELYHAWYDNILPEQYELVDKAVSKIIGGKHAEVQYPWNAPDGRTIYIRCGGVRNESYTKGIRMEGIHQDVTELFHFQHESITYSALAQALGGNFESVYYVDLKTNKYKEYISQGEFKKLHISSEGNDFYKESIQNIPDVVFVGDQEKLKSFFNKEEILSIIEEKKQASIRYRLMIKGNPVYYTLSAVKTKDEKSLIFGIRNIQTEVDHEEEYKEKIRKAAELANIDGLTGIRNRLAYEDLIERFEEQISNGEINPFALAVFDINDLKVTNDKYGHSTGDAVICSASQEICETFRHSQVFRIGGDEFAAILQGKDFFKNEELMQEFRTKMKNNRRENKVSVSSGIAKFDFEKDNDFSSIFKRADTDMYRNKKENKK